MAAQLLEWTPALGRMEWTERDWKITQGNKLAEGRRKAIFLSFRIFAIFLRFPLLILKNYVYVWV